MLGARPESNQDELRFGVPAALQIAPIVDSLSSPAPATPALSDEPPVNPHKTLRRIRQTVRRTALRSPLTHRALSELSPVTGRSRPDQPFPVDRHTCTYQLRPWKSLYAAVILETIRGVLSQRVSEAEAAVIARRREIFYADGTPEEKEALDDALYALHAFTTPWQHSEAA